MERYQPGDEEGEETEEQHEQEDAVVADLKNRLKRTKVKSSGENDKDVPEKKAKEDDQEVLQEQKGKKSKKKKKSKENKKSEQTEFTTLGEQPGQKRAKVRRVLPDWLANPDVVSVDLKGDRRVEVGQMEGLDGDLRERLASRGIESFFPVQAQVIPHLLDSPRNRLFRPGDVCVSAPTGSGKTLAFVLPLVQALRRRVVPRVRAVVVLPVQDLAAQVYSVFQSFAEGTGLRVRLLSASKPFAKEQYELVRKGAVGWHSMADVVVATPGRLVDHVKKTEGFSLAHLRYLVIDEADRVMEDVQNDWLAVVEEAVYSEGRTRPRKLTAAEALGHHMPLQKLLFSATLSQNPEQLEQLRLFEPRLFTSVVKPKKEQDSQEDEQQQQEFVGQYTTPAELSEHFAVCHDSLKKPQLLYHLMRSRDMKKALVFTKSLEHTHSLAVLLKQYGLAVEELSSQVRFTTRESFHIQYLSLND